MPKVSVVITTYNYGHLIGETLSSVFAQTFDDFEVIVVDDASTDNTREVMAHYACPRLRCITHSESQRSWPSASRNEAIHAASGQYIAFIDADDLWLPHKLELQIKCFESNPAHGMVYCDVEDFEHPSGRSLGRISDGVYLPAGDILVPLLISNCILSPSPVVRCAVFEEVGLWDERIRKCEDWDLWLRIADRYPVGLVSQVLARRRVHTGSQSMREDLYEAYTDALDDVERAVARNPNRLEKYRGRALANVAYATGKKMLQRHDYAAAWQMFRRGIRSYPGSLRLYGGLALLITDRIFGRTVSQRLRLGRWGKRIPL